MKKIRNSEFYVNSNNKNENKNNLQNYNLFIKKLLQFNLIKMRLI